MPVEQAPPQIVPARLGDYLDVMSRAVFQSGISWRVVEAKWPGTRAAFRDFDPEVVAALGPDEIDALASDTRLIRNRRKIEATVNNAARLIALDAEHGGFRNYLRSQPDFESRVQELRRQFKFLGDTGCYYFLYVVGEEVPPHEQWMAARASKAPAPRRPAAKRQPRPADAPPGRAARRSAGGGQSPAVTGSASPGGRGSAS